MEWYYTAGKERRGPVDEATLRALVEGGEIAPDALVWNSGMADWAPCESVFSRAEPAHAAPPPLPAAPAYTPKSPVSAPVPSNDQTARFYFQWLIMEFVLGSVFQIISFAHSYDMSMRIASFLLQGIFWLGMFFGANALRVRSRMPWDTVRNYIIAPMATGLLYFAWFQGMRWGLFGGTSVLLALPYSFYIVVSFAIRIVALICAIFGLKALRRVSA